MIRLLSTHSSMGKTHGLPRRWINQLLNAGSLETSWPSSWIFSLTEFKWSCACWRGFLLGSVFPPISFSIRSKLLNTIWNHDRHGLINMNTDSSPIQFLDLLPELQARCYLCNNLAMPLRSLLGLCTVSRTDLLTYTVPAEIV